MGWREESQSPLSVASPPFSSAAQPRREKRTPREGLPEPLNSPPLPPPPPLHYITPSIPLINTTQHREGCRSIAT